MLGRIALDLYFWTVLRRRLSFIFAVKDNIMSRSVVFCLLRKDIMVIPGDEIITVSISVGDIILVFGFVD